LSNPLSLPAANSQICATKISQLSQALDGTLITPITSNYESARSTSSFNPRYNRYPALIAKCFTESDVVRALGFTQENDLPIAVSSGGHVVLSAATVDNGLLIDLQPLSKIDINNAADCAGPGVLAGQLDYSLSEAGLALPLTCNPSIGVAGLTLRVSQGWFMGS
jgi:FAD/FMN-containing dehydrogenase